MKEELQTYFNLEKSRGNIKDLAFEELYSEFHQFQKSFFPKIKKSDKWKDDFDFLQLIYYRNSILWLNINSKFEFPYLAKFDEVSSLFFDFTNIMTLTQNNLLVINHLCDKGFDHQASLIVRNHLELVELSLSIFGDQKMYEFYKELLGESGEEINRSIKFSNTSKANQKILKNLREKAGFEIYDGFFKDLSDFKINYYKNYSSAVHPDRTTVWLSAHSLNDDGETLQTCYGGRRSEKTRQIMYDIFLIEVILFQYVIAIQINNHKMHFEKYGEDAQKMSFYVAAVWHIYGLKLKKYHLNKAN